MVFWAGNASAEIPEPPVVIYGSLENSSGVEVTGGELRFYFIPSGGGQTVTVEALVGSLAPGIQFVAEAPVESNAVSDPSVYLERTSDYEPRVYYEGVRIPDSQLGALLVAERGEVIGPIAYTVNPTLLASLSGNLDFGPVRLGEYLELLFVVSNPGTVSLTGSCSLDEGTDFMLMDGGIPVSSVAVLLGPSETMDVWVRFAPTSAGWSLFDTFRVVTNAGEVERSVTGLGTVEWTPTPTPVVTPTPTTDDRDGDGIPDDLEADRAPLAGQTNGYLPDSDGDGLWDGVEDANRNGQRDMMETDARFRDSDGDAYEDGVEVLFLASNPLVSSDPPDPAQDMDTDGLPHSLDPDSFSTDSDADRFLDGYEAVTGGLASVSDDGTKPTLGDVDLDGFYDNADSQRILNFFANIPNLVFEAENSDVTRDAYIDNADAQIMLNFFARIQDVLPRGDLK
jgi:hypothetical protein